MKQINLWMLAAILTLCCQTVLTSCSDQIDTPVTPTPDNPICPTDTGAWTIDDLRDMTVKAGDDFYMHAIGSWWKQTEIDPEFGITSLVTDLSTQNMVMMQSIADEGITILQTHQENTTNNAESDDATVNKAVAVIEGADSRETLWRSMGELKKQGYQMPFHLACLSKNGRMVLVFIPMNYSEFKTYRPGISDGGYDYYEGNDDNYGESKSDLWKKLLNDPRLASALRPVTSGGRTRGFQRDEWPMLVAVCQGLGVNPDEAYVLTDFTDGVLGDLSKLDIGTQYYLKQIQEMDVEDLKNELLTYVEEDRLIFDKAYHEVYGQPDGNKLMSGISQYYMMYYMAHVYAKHYVTPEMRQLGEEYVGELKEAFRQRIEANTWLSGASKVKVLEKLDDMVVNVAYPNWIEEGLPDFTGTKSFLEDVMEMRRANVSLMNWITGKTLAEGSFHAMIATMVDYWELNAFYAANFNSINILPAWLMKPFYEEGAATAYNYAALMTYGHEITHGFDTIGSQWDKDGEQNSIWASPADEQEFDRRAKLLADFFSQIEVAPGVFANGTKTLAENIADLGGMELAFQALTNNLKQRGFTGSELRLQQQRFFYAVASHWRAKYTDQYAESTTKTDVHSLARERINGPVSNMDAWHDLFDVQPGQKLYRTAEERIHIW